MELLSTPTACPDVINRFCGKSVERRIELIMEGRREDLRRWAV